MLITFAFLLQFGSYLADVNHPPAPQGATSFVRSLLVHRRRLIEVVIDFALITAAFTIAYIIRVEGTGTIWQRHIFNLSLPVILISRYVLFFAFGLYRGVWRYAGARDATSIFAAVVLSELVAFIFLSLTVTWNGFPRGTFLIDVLLCTMLIGASRFGSARSLTLRNLVGRGDQRRSLIVGAGKRVAAPRAPGDFGRTCPRLRRRRSGTAWTADQGVPVVGTLDQSGWPIGGLEPVAVLVTIPAAPRERLDAVVEACGRAEVACRFVRRQADLDPSVVLGAATE